MIIWLTGNSGSGKTTVAYTIKNIFFNWIVLDGDEMRHSISRDLGLSKNDRIKNNIIIARLANILHKQGFNIIISSIAPFQCGRELVNKIINCIWIYIEGGKTGYKYPYEIPDCIRFNSIQQLQDIIKENL
jgi:adenylylsulfate kinase-like enzyme